MPALAAEAIPTNLCFVEMRSPTQAVSSRAAHTANAREESTTISGRSSGCRPRIPTALSNGVSGSMVQVLLSPIRSMHAHRARRRFTLTALQMMMASGVIRPSHVALTYSKPLLSAGILRTTGYAGKCPIIARPTLFHRQTRVQSETALAQWARTLPTTVANLAKRPIGLQRNTD
jgi:hypothetical protein